MRNLSFLFVAFLFLQLTTFAQWIQKADIPTARCMTTSCTLDSLIYVIGGTESTNPSGPSVGTMEVYDPIADSWDTTKADMPTSRVELGACAVNEKIYAIGGAITHSSFPFGMVEEYDPSTNDWDTNKEPMPTPRKGAAYGVIDNKIYVAGGTTVAGFTASNKLEIYDPLTDTWVDTLETMLDAMYSPTGAVINDKFYVIGGLLGYPPWTGQKIVQMYDPTIDEWSPVVYLNYGRVGHTTNGIAGYIYAIGGDTQPPIVRHVEKYDPYTNIWTEIDFAPFVKTGNTASVFENKIYLISGSTTSLLSGFTPTSTVYSFDPSYFQDTIHIPTDYPTIQEGIDSSGNGDIVLVEDGTYYENINFKGKAITVASHFILDSLESHIENTIIDGSQPSHPDSGSVVLFNSGEDTTSVLCGFSITGGTGTYYAPYDDVSGGGINLFLSGAKICNNIIEYNSVSYNNYSHGGGIIADVDGISIIIENNIIRNNTTNANTGTTGGGISLWNADYARVVNNKIIDNIATCSFRAWGGGINCNGPSNELTISNNLIKGNECITNDRGGGGIAIYDGTPVVNNNLILDNSAFGGGGILLELGTNTSSPSGNNNPGRGSVQNNGLNSNQYISKVTQSETLLENNTIINNNAVYGGGIRSIGYTPEMMNCIIWGNTAPNDPQISGPATVTYSDVEGGYTGMGNINEDPQFDLTHPYSPVMSSSLCIDAGNPDPMYFDVGAGGNPLPPAQGSLINDMGHCGGPASLWYLWDWPMPVNEIDPVITEYILMQNYPNPFNPTTIIKYGISERTFVELRVYDILGREVASLINEEQDTGYYEINFNAAKFSSGVYLYQLKAGSFVETKKMLLLK